MAGSTGARYYCGVIEVGRTPGAGFVACVTSLRGRDMSRGLSLRVVAVVAGGARISGDCSVTHGRRSPGYRTVAGVACGRGRTVRNALALGVSTVVAAHTGSRNHRGMAERGREPSRRLVAGIAALRGHDMAGGFAPRSCAVVAGCAGSGDDTRVIEHGCIPRIALVAGIARLGCRHVRSGHDSCCDPRAGGVTSFAIARRALEYSLHMAGFTRGLRMRRVKRKANSQMVEFGVLTLRTSESRRREQHKERDPKQVAKKVSHFRTPLAPRRRVRQSVVT